jgi:prepilin-type processing-associated H-X9-DG protein
MRSRQRFGVTLIESMTCVATVLVLIAIILPAVQALREASRRVQCGHHLRSIGLALHDYHATHGVLPHVAEALVRPGGPPSPPVVALRYFSVQTRLLPALGMDHVYHLINFEVAAATPIVEPNPFEMGGEANRTVRQFRIQQFLCPSDPSADDAVPGNNYRACLGIGPFPVTSVEFPDSGQGIFGNNGGIDWGKISDGLSHTCAFAERLRGSGLKNSMLPDRDLGLIPSPGYTAEAYRNACRFLTPSDPVFTSAGDWWFFTGTEWTLYNHLLGPNDSVPDCATPGIIPIVGSFAARSLHPNGVHALFADGSIRFVGDSIELRIWRAYSTRSSGDAVGGY